LQHDEVNVDVFTFLILVLLPENLGNEVMMAHCLVGHEDIGQEVMGCLPPGHQRVHQVLDMGIELDNVTSIG